MASSIDGAASSIILLHGLRSDDKSQSKGWCEYFRRLDQVASVWIHIYAFSASKLLRQGELEFRALSSDFSRRTVRLLDEDVSAKLGLTRY